MKAHSLVVVMLLLVGATACGGGSSGGKSGAVIFDLDMPEALDKLSLNDLRVTGTAFGANAPQQEATLTIRGTYKIPLKLQSGSNYPYNLTVYYKAASFYTPSGSVTDTVPTVEIASPDLVACPNLSLNPDSSLVDGQWLKLCTVNYEGIFTAGQTIQVPRSAIDCSELDADGDGLMNLSELDLVVQPYNGDFDGDCVPDGLDAFPKDKNEWKDTDGDGVGDNEDVDRDGDSLNNQDEATKGTDPLNPDTDSDGVMDGFDNCPLNGSSSDQTDTNGDGLGDLCQNDADGDGLSNTDETQRGTDPKKWDTDGDGLSDGIEVTQGTNPLKIDTDGDGVNDKEDAFPTNPNETKDTDGDKVGDNADNCPSQANQDQKNTEGDAQGDACDPDDDNDGLTDILETKIGSNSLNVDTDGDGLTDWFGGTIQNGQDPCLLIAQGNHSDGDGDGFGVVCDCNDNNAAVNPAASDLPDPSGIDQNCDGIDGDKLAAIFVDGVNGSDAGNGTLNQPVKTLQKAGELALVSNKSVYVLDGTYTFTSSFVLPSGVMFYGGFSAGFSSRDLSGTELTTQTIQALIVVLGTGPGTGLDGFTLFSTYQGEGPSIAVEVMNGALSLTHNTVEVIHNTHGTGIDGDQADLTLSNNHIRVSGGNSIGYGIRVNNSTGSFVSNKIEVHDFQISRTAIECLDAGDTDFGLQNNTLDVWPNAAVEDTAAVYITECGIGPGRQHYALPGSVNVPGFDDLGGNVLDGLF